MAENNKDHLKSFNDEIRKVKIITTPGAIMLGLAGYSKLVANGNAFLPILNNDSVVIGMLIFGVASIVWGAFKIKAIAARYRRPQNEQNA